MAKSTLVGWCGVFSLVVFMAIAPLSAEDSSSSAASSTSSASNAVEKRSSAAVPDNAIRDAEDFIDEILDRQLKSPLMYEAEQLDLILSELASEYELPLVFDRAALEEIGVQPDSEVSLRVQAISLRSALNLIFKEPGLEDLAYAVVDEVLLITTEERRNEMLVAEVYRVDDLVADASRGRDAGKLTADHLIDMILVCIEHDSWMEHGTGVGEIRYLPPGMIVVSQPRHIQRQIDQLFQQIRATKRVIVTEQQRQ